jgi:membrane protein YdbS with pleckstrin-like domain
MIDPQERIEANRARRAHERQVRLWVTIANIVVLLAGITIDKINDVERGQGIAPITGFIGGTVALGISWWQSKDREGVEQQGVRKAIVCALALIAAFAIGAEVWFLTDTSRRIAPGTFLLVVGVALMIGNGLFCSSSSADG